MILWQTNQPMRFPTTLIAGGLLVIATLLSSAADGTKKVLFFSKSSGFQHSVIKRNAGQPAYAEQVLKELGAKHGFEFTFSKDGSLFNPTYLVQFDAYFFYTTGDLTEAGTDKNPPMSTEGKQAFLDAIKGGKGFVGTHSATDTFHSPGNKANGEARFSGDAVVDPYIAMIGGEFIKHGAQQTTKLVNNDPAFPGAKSVPAAFGPQEEWYSLKNFSRDLHVILTQDTAGMKGNEYARPPYPSTWARVHGNGRVFYTNMGHREDVWTNPVFQDVLIGGLSWATRRVDADVTPNLAKAAPDASKLPTFVAPQPKAPKKKDAKKAAPAL